MCRCCTSCLAFPRTNINKRAISGRLAHPDPAEIEMKKQQRSGVVVLVGEKGILEGGRGGDEGILREESKKRQGSKCTRKKKKGRCRTMNSLFCFVSLFYLAAAVAVAVAAAYVFILLAFLLFSCLCGKPKQKTDTTTPANLAAAAAASASASTVERTFLWHTWPSSSSFFPWRP